MFVTKSGREKHVAMKVQVNEYENESNFSGLLRLSYRF